MKLHKKAIIYLICFSVFCTKAFSAIKLPYFFSDNMVLQQQAKPLIWGWSKEGSKVTIVTSWDKKKVVVTADSKGKWKTNVVTPSAGGPFEIKISEAGSAVSIKNILIGEVWLCSGQSNMAMSMAGFKDQPILGATDAIINSTNDKIRLFTVPRSPNRVPQDSVAKLSWDDAKPVSVSKFSATAYYFGRLLQEKLKVPVGLICISSSSTAVESFMDEEALKPFPEIPIHPKLDTIKKVTHFDATTVYNGMLHPFLGFAIKGCIWYQGESNYKKPKQYESLLPAFVKMLRTKSSNDNFPFYYVQIAPYKYGTNELNPKLNSAWLRDAQRKALAKIPNSGMAVTLDIGLENFIHPSDKESVGKRLAYMALAKTYNLEGYPAGSPMYESVSFKANVATILFSNTSNGLTSYGKPLSYFEIAGEDKVFYPAEAKISQGKVEVSAPEVPNPVAVRYAFKDFVIGDLFNTEGFPASSFRTDDW